MSKRDHVQEVLDVKGRGGHVNDGVFEMKRVQAAWLARNHAHASIVDDFFLMRAVTALEVFVKGWTAALVDRGSPYAENAATLTSSGVKFDYGVALEHRTVRITRRRVPR